MDAKMLEGVDVVPWTSLPQPESNRSDAVPCALRRLGAATSEQQANKAYHQFLFAIGNNHAGSYYPVVLEAVPFLGEILESGDEWAQARTLDILIDLLASFGPEPGHETIEGAGGVRLQVDVLLGERIGRLSPAVEALAQDVTRDACTRELAVELLGYLAPGAA